MRRLLKGSLWSILIAVFVFAGCDQAPLAPTDPIEEPAARNGDIIPDQYIVVLKPANQLAGKTAPQVLDELTGERDVTARYRYETALTGFAAALSGEALARLEGDERVAYVEPDRVITLPEVGMLGDVDATKGKPSGVGGGGSAGQEIPWGITRVGGPVVGTGKTAWILDTGIDLDHPDLNVDQARGFTAFNKGKDATPNDGNGHGTHVAGTIAALNNTIGVVGVAAGALVVPVKVLNSRGSGSYSGVIDGVEYVAANGEPGDVANMSLSGPASTALDTAVLNAAATKGITFVLAAGNESDNADNHSPARANGPNVYTISAFSDGDNWASFSNYGNPPIDYAAPGVGIKSTWKSGGYNTISGTSMASPHAAGVLLLGSAVDGGFVKNDPDDNADTIITH